jgi:hypothetical protein
MEISCATNGRQIPKKIIIYNPKRKRAVGSSQLRLKDHHTLQEDGIGHV